MMSVIHACNYIINVYNKIINRKYTSTCLFGVEVFPPTVSLIMAILAIYFLYSLFEVCVLNVKTGSSSMQ